MNPVPKAALKPLSHPPMAAQVHGFKARKNFRKNHGGEVAARTFFLVKHNAVQRTPGMVSFMHGDKTPFDIHAGETILLDLGVSNKTVTAHLMWPAGMQRQPDWQISGTLHTPVPEFPQETEGHPLPAKELAKILRQRVNGVVYPVAIQTDDALSVEDVAAGDYELSVNVEVQDAGISKKIATAKMTVPIPADPSSENLDLGAVEMKAHRTSHEHVLGHALQASNLSRCFAPISFLLKFERFGAFHNKNPGRL